MRERFVKNQQYVNAYSDVSLIYMPITQYITLSVLQVSSTREGKITALINGSEVMTFLIPNHGNLYVPLKLHLEPSDTFQLVGNSYAGTDFNSTIIYYDNQEIWNQNFIQELETTIKV